MRELFNDETIERIQWRLSPYVGMDSSICQFFVYMKDGRLFLIYFERSYQEKHHMEYSLIEDERIQTILGAHNISIHGTDLDYMMDYLDSKGYNPRGYFELGM